MPLPFSNTIGPWLVFATLALAAAPPVFLPQEESAPEPATGPWLELPDGPAAKAFAAIDPLAEEVETMALDAPLPLSEAAGWEAWARWVEAATNPDAEERARARAALLSIAQNEGRAKEAWSHFVALGDHPKWSIAFLSRLLPGVPAGTQVLPGGAPGPLPDGVLLKPTIPPAEPLPGGGLRGRKALVRGLQIGEALVDFEISFDAYGVQIDLRLMEGEAAAVRVILPQPEGYEVRFEYVDWMRQDEVGEERLVELSKETPKLTLFGRILPRNRLYPRAEPGQLSRGLELSGLVLSLPADEGTDELVRMRAVAAALAKASGLQVHLEIFCTEGEGSPPGATRVRLPAAGPERETLLRWLVSAVEGYRLQG